ncbi:protein PFC0760c-like [Macrobrachium nipponense]|uniref:protein PFC0760c-like n=1 Tax=Macrobrachium nipponense TaxID=159736 RepID=UPI0030C838CE
MKTRTFVIRILSILLQFGALNAGDSMLYARCHQNLTSSTGSVSEKDFTGLSCSEHEIRIQAGVPIVFTCLDLVLKVGSQQYCLSIGGIKNGKPRMHKLDDNDDDSNKSGKRKHNRKYNIKSSVKSYAKDSDAPWKRSKRGAGGQTKVNENKIQKKIEKLTSKLQNLEDKIQKLENKIAKLEGKPNKKKQLAKLEKKVNKLKSKSETLQNKIDKLESRLTTTVGYTDDTNGNDYTDDVSDDNNYATNDPDHSDDVSGDDSPDGDYDTYDTYDTDNSDDVTGDDYTDGDYDTYDTDNSDDVTGDDYTDGDYDTYDTDNSDDVSGDYYPDGDSDNDDVTGTDNMQDAGYSDDVYGDESPNVKINRSTMGSQPQTKIHGMGKPNRNAWRDVGYKRKKNSGKIGKGEIKGTRKGSGKKQSFCGPQDKPVTINSQTGEIGLSVRPNGLKKGSGRKRSKPLHRGNLNASHGKVKQDPAGSAVVMIPSKVKYTCSWSPASP